MKSFKFLVGFVVAASVLLLLVFYRGAVGDIFLGLRSAFAGFFGPPADSERVKVLETENRILREELARLAEGESHLFSADYIYKRARIYSRYPWNDRRLIVIDAGGRDGVKEGLPVLAGEGVLLGRIKSVSRTQSVVETVFNPEWRSSVLILGDGVKALLKGGLPPVLELIAREAKINKGDAVLNTSPDFPLDLRLGTLDEVEPVLNEAWLAATLNTPYALLSLDEVLVILNFPD